MLHPTNGDILTDRFGATVQVGRRCVIAVKWRKYSGASLANGTITKIVPLIEAPGVWHSTGPDARIPFWREDQLSKSHQTEYYPPQDENGNTILSHAYVASVRVDGGGGNARTVPYGLNLIVIP